MKELRILEKSNPLICIDDIIINLDKKNSGKSYFKLKKEFVDDKKYYSYIFRRPRFVDELLRLNEIYKGIFYIEFTEEQKRNRKLKKKKVNTQRKVEIQNKYSQVILTPSYSDIVSTQNGFKDDNVYNVDKNMFHRQDSEYNFHFIWQKLKDSDIQLEVSKLKFSPHNNSGVRRETYFHCIFDFDLKICNHIDSHVFKYNSKDYSKRERDFSIKTRGLIPGRNPLAKYDHFSMCKNAKITSYEAIVLLTKFLDDTRVDYYFSNLLKDLSKTQI